MLVLASIIIICSIATFIINHLKIRPENEFDRPTPSCLPVVRNAPVIPPTCLVTDTELGSNYDEVFTINLLSLRLVVLNSVEAIRAALIDDGRTFILRPRFRSPDSMQTQNPWRDNRRCALRTLNECGVAQALIFDAIHEELGILIEALENRSGCPVSTKRFFAKATFDVISRLITGRRLSEDEAKDSELLSEIIFVVEKADKFRYNVIDIFPFLRNITALSSFCRNTNFRNHCGNGIHDFILESIRSHLETNDTKSQPRDVIDALISHKTALESACTDPSLDIETMATVIFDLLIAGSDTTALTLSWGIVLMAVHPQIQATAKSEISNLLGSQSFPRIHDASKLNYTLAVIDEIKRFSSIASSSLIYRTSQNVVIGTRQIPADAIVIPNIYAVHHDPTLWKYPNNFNPRNFLDANGNYKASGNLIQFTSGTQTCLEDSLADIEFFIIFVGLLQRYSVSQTSQKSNDVRKVLFGIEGIVRHLEFDDIVFHSDP